MAGDGASSERKEVLVWRVYQYIHIHIYIYSICIYVCTVYVYMYVQYIHSDNTVAFVKQTG